MKWDSVALDNAINEMGVMQAYKRGVLHGLLYQTRDNEQTHEYYRKGYNFGMDIYHGTTIYKGELKPKDRRINNES
jgi:hypothetical protein